MRFVKPLDEEAVLSLARGHEVLVTVEENAAGGAGAAVGECLAAHGVAARLLHLGLPDRFIQHGGRGDMLADAGLDAAGIARSVEEYLARHAGGPDGGDGSGGDRSSAGGIAAPGG